MRYFWTRCGMLFFVLLQMQTTVLRCQAMQEPFNYPAFLKQIQTAQKLHAENEYDNRNAVVELIQSEGYPLAIREAVKRGDAAGLLELYQAKFGTQWPRTVKGTNVLIYACINKDVDVVKQLIARGMNVNAANPQKWTPLHAAAEAGSVECVKLLLAKKADVNARTDRFMDTPLMLACGEFSGGGHDGLECARLLIAKGAHVNAQTSWLQTPLMFAASFGRVETVKLLLAEGADATIMDEKGKTALTDILPFEFIDEHGMITMTQDSKTYPVYKISVLAALVSHGKAMHGEYRPGDQEKVEKDGLNDFRTIDRLLREAGAQH